jgi:arylsulfate sulfotransferase
LNYSIMHRNYALLIFGVAIVLGLTGLSFATPTVSLSPSLASPQPVGTVITWTATASDNDPGTLMYSFSVGTKASLALVRDFGYLNSFPSDPPLEEGTYQVQVIVRNNSTGKTATANQSIVATAIANSNNPVVISPTANPLVALFSAAPCSAPDSMQVGFKSATGAVQFTPLKPCNKGSLNFYIAGMLPKTQYSMQGILVNSGQQVGKTKIVNFTTGALSIPVPTITVTSPAPAEAANEPILVHSYVTPFPIATDLSGNVVWYYDPYDGLGGLLTRAVAGGFFWFYGNGNSDPYLQPFRKIDVAGNTVVETNIGRINEQLIAAGQMPLTDIDHEVRTMPNGNILMIGSLDEVLGPGIQGGADVIFNELVVLNPQLQLVWSWNAITCGNCATMLPTSRAAILGETCTVGQGGCPPLTPPNTIANDWLHGNCAQLATDGSILMSLRHQDWVLKIDYGNGKGTGNILWRLGLDGDFSIVGDPNDNYPWFSHQHDAEWQFGSDYIALFDNGNTRFQRNNGGNSRGQVLQINQGTMVATLVENIDQGVQSTALGTSQLLLDKNGEVNGLHNEAGFVNFTTSQTSSFYASGTLVMTSSVSTYRSLQMHDLYTPDVQH